MVLDKSSDTHRFRNKKFDEICDVLLSSVTTIIIVKNSYFGSLQLRLSERYIKGSHKHRDSNKRKTPVIIIWQ